MKLLRRPSWGVPILCLWLLAFAVFSLPLFGASAVKLPPDGPSKVEDYRKPLPVRFSARGGWIFIKLPRLHGEPLMASPNGVVLLRDTATKKFTRWKAGSTLELGPDSTEARVEGILDIGANQGVHTFRNFAMSATGAIALSYVYSTPSPESNFWNTTQNLGSGVWDEYIRVWSPQDNVAKIAQGSRYRGNINRASIYGGGNYKFDVKYARESKLFAISTDQSSGLDYVTGRFSVMLGQYTGSSGDYIFIKLLAKTPPYATALFEYSYGVEYYLTAMNDQGQAVGLQAYLNDFISGVVDRQFVPFIPIYISENGIVLGRHEIPEISYEYQFGVGVPLESDSPAQVMYSTSLGEIPLPSDGSVTWVDEQDRPNGFAPDGKPVVWTPKKGSDGVASPALGYDREYYVPLPMPEGWTTNPAHMIPPNTVKHQLGIVRQANVTQPFLAIHGGLYVDASRDGKIEFDGSDDTPATNPYRFWLNDDIDKLHTFSDSAADTMTDINETEEDDLQISPNGKKDWENNYIGSKRDLEDFARLSVYIGGLTDALRTGQLSLGLKWTDTTGTPAVKLYKHVEADGGIRYLTEEAVAEQQVNAAFAVADARDTALPQNSTRSVVEGSDVFVLPAALFSGLSEAAPKTNLLFEGCKPGKGRLKLVILKKDGSNYTEIGEGPGVWIDLKKIGDMYEHWSVGNGSGGAPDAVAARIPSLTGSGSAFKYDNGGPSPEEQKYILFVHGWNMEQWEKERYAETAYKRLWWQGYKGRFGLFSWPCTNRFDETTTLGKVVEGLSDGTNFDRGEWTAWRSGAPLRQLLQTLNGAYDGSSYVFSHSMGGIVVSEALRRQSDAGGGKIVNVYVASQAALSAHLYDGTLSAATGSANAVQWTYAHPSLVGGPVNYGPQTPNVYQNWCAFVLGGGSGATSAVGSLVNFYNQNDYALAAPVWQFNQITKPDYPDRFNGQPWSYAWLQNENYPQGKFLKSQSLPLNVVDLDRGTRADPKDRFEITAFAAESPVKSFGATANLTQGVTRSIDLRSIWPADNGDHKAHIWHSGQFRSTLPKQKNYWKALLSDQAFDITTTTLP